MEWLVAEDMSKLSLLLGGKGPSAWTPQQTFLWRTCFSNAMKKLRRVSGSWQLIIHHLESSITVNIKLAEKWVDILHLTWSPGSSRENTKHWNVCVLGGFPGEEDVMLLESILLFLPQHLFIYFLACRAWRVATDQRAVWLYKLFGKSSSLRSLHKLQSGLCFVTRWKVICDVCAVWPACSITAGCVCVCMNLTNVGLQWHKSTFYLCVCVCVCVLLCAYLMQRRRSSSIFMWTKRCFVSVRGVNVYEVCFIWFLSVCEKQMDIYTPYQIYKGRVECVYRCLQQLKSK